MKKKILSIIGLAAFVGAVAFNISIGSNDAEMDVTLANIEALAQSETSEEFENATDCIACTVNHTCSGKDGKTHSWAHHKNDTSHN